MWGVVVEGKGVGGWSSRERVWGVVVEGKGVGIAAAGKVWGVVAERCRMVAVLVGRVLAEEGAEESFTYLLYFTLLTLLYCTLLYLLH